MKYKGFIRYAVWLLILCYVMTLGSIPVYADALPIHRYVLETDTYGQQFFSVLSNVGSYNEVSYTLGNKEPAILRFNEIELTRSITSDTSMWQWRNLVETGLPDYLEMVATVIEFDNTGQEIGRWAVEDAWLSSISMSVNDAGQMIETITLVGSEIQRDGTAQPVYSITSINDYTYNNLTQGYTFADLETKTFQIVNDGTEALSGISVSIDTPDFDMTNPQVNTLPVSGSQTSFTITPKSDLVSGVYQGTVTIQADNMTDVTFIVSLTVEAIGVDATLKDLSVGGSTISGFSSAVTSYSKTLPYGTGVNSSTAQVTGIATDSKATVHVTMPSSLPGTAIVAVVAEDGITTINYRVSLSVASNNNNSSNNNNNNQQNNNPPQEEEEDQPEEQSTDLFQEALTQATTNDAGETVLEMDFRQGSEEAPSIIGIEKTYFNDDNQILNIHTDIASVIIPDDLFDNQPEGNIGISIQAVSSEDLPPRLQARFGNKPIIDITMTMNGEPIQWDNQDKTVEVFIPYEPTVNELRHPNRIVAVYLADDGEVIPVKMSQYNAERGGIIMSLSHFSQYSVESFEHTFTDISEDMIVTVEALAARGIVQGISSDTFAPDMTISRAELVTLLIRMFDFTNASEEAFKDVSEDMYYYDPIHIARMNQLVYGIGGNRFNPNALVSGEELAVMLYRALERKGLLDALGTSEVIPLEQSLVSAYAKEASERLWSSGLMEDTDMFTRNISRGEVAKVLYELLKRLGE